jgi:hypothetical protein
LPNQLGLLLAAVLGIAAGVITETLVPQITVPQPAPASASAQVPEETP